MSGETVHTSTIFGVTVHVSTVFVSMIHVSMIHVCRVTFHDKRSPVHDVPFHPRYNTEISPVERRKTAKIIIIKNFNTFFLPVMIAK